MYQDATATFKSGSILRRCAPTEAPYRLPPLDSSEVKARLCLNEGTARLPWQVKFATWQASLRCFSKYPVYRPEPLLTNLANYCGADKECIELFSGSDQLLEAVVLATSKFAWNGQERSKSIALIAGPSYSQPQNFSTRYCNETFEYLSTNPAWQIDLDALGRRLEEVKPNLCYICNPNNPTGQLHEATALLRLIKAHPQVQFLIDEAYIEFGGQSMATHATTERNLIVARTFSKAFSLAGLRLGYGIMHPATRKALAPYVNDKNISFLDAAIGSTALTCKRYMEKHVARVARIKDSLAGFLEANHLEVIKGGGNFLLFSMPSEWCPNFERIMEQGQVKIRSFNKVLGVGWYRVSLTDNGELAAFSLLFPVNPLPRGINPFDPQYRARHPMFFWPLS